MTDQIGRQLWQKTKEDSDMRDCIDMIYVKNKTDQIGCSLWRKLDKTTTWTIVQVQSTLKTKLSCHDWSDWVQFVMKTKQNNDVTDCKSAIYYDITLKRMTWCNKFKNHYLFIDVPISLLSILIPCIILYEHSYLHLLHYTWLRCIRSCTEDLSHGFLENRWLVHSWFLGLVNPLEVVVHHLLIGKMDGLGYWNGFPMVSALVCVVAY